MSLVFPPLSIQDLGMLLAVSAVLLLFTAELVPYIFGDKTLVSDIKKLRNMASVIVIILGN